MMIKRFGALLGFVSLFAGCTPGYLTADKLERSEQGPSACEARCHELGMRMGALVLVSDNLPACVCQPPNAPQHAPRAQPPSGPPPAADEESGAGAVGGYVVVAAAAAAARQQQMDQQRRQQQTYKSK